MRILVDINHPAQVHLFRNAIALWREAGNRVLITARDKEMTTRLLDLYNLDYRLTSRQRDPNLANLIIGVIESDLAVWKAARKFSPDWMIGTSFAIAHLSKLLRGRSIVFAEDSFESTVMFWRLTVPFADFIVTPSSLKDDFGQKHIWYEGYQELAYLHPNQFKPDRNLIKELLPNLNKPFFILRFVSLRASHDIGQKGISMESRRALIKKLLRYGHVFITSEDRLPDEFAAFELKLSPEKIHHALAFADMLVTDSQSMTIEAAVLGVPAIRCNTFVGRTPVIKELEEKYGLTFGFTPQNTRGMFAKIDQLLSQKSLKGEWMSRRQKMLDEKIDLTPWIVNLPARLRSGEST